MHDEFDPYYTAIKCAEEGFPVRPAVTLIHQKAAVDASSDPIWNHERWSAEFKGCAVEMPTGTTSGTLAVRIAKLSNDNPKNGFPALFEMEAKYGALVATPFYEDADHWTLIYECPDDTIIHGTVTIAPGITLLGNGANITLPPYVCPGENRSVAFADGYGLSRQALVMAPDWLVSKGVGAELLLIIRQWQLEDTYLQDLAA